MIVRIEEVRKSFSSLEVLKGISLEIGERQVVSIVGPSGAGKTTLLQIMGTLDRPSSGKVTLEGQDVLKMSENQLSDFRNRHVGFVFQQHQLLGEFTALENVMIPALIAGTPRKKAEQEASMLLRDLGLQDRMEHKPSELSGGERQRVAVARALVNKPALVLADEPSGSLDSENRRELHQLFFSLRDRLGLTFVIVTHDDELADMADRKIRLMDGRILDDSVNGLG